MPRITLHLCLCSRFVKSVHVVFAAMVASLLSGCALSMLCPARAEPTATEVFHLQTECASLAKKRFENDSSDPKGVGAVRSYRANYNPKTGRCYYEFTVFWPDDSNVLISLYDLQREAIAHANNKTGPMPCLSGSGRPCSYVPKKAAKNGEINLGAIATTVDADGKMIGVKQDLVSVSYQEARDYIDAMMGE
jgi:hypothetical protein